jgi:hypothetical protein
VPVSDSHVYFYNAGQLATAESICHLRLGQTERATVTAQVAMDTIDSSFVRNVAMAALLLGTCQLASAKPQIDQAAHALSTAGRLAAHNRSARLTHRLHSSVRALEPWQDNEAVQTVRAELAVYQVVE